MSVSDTHSTRQKVLILRSTGVVGDSRTERIARAASLLTSDTYLLYWNRSRVPPPSFTGVKAIGFSLKSRHGAGWANLFGVFAWNAWLILRIVKIRPSLIYACDLDTGVAARVGRFLTGSPYVYDQFDSYDVRISNKSIKRFVRGWEEMVAKAASTVVVPSKNRQVGKFSQGVIIENAPDVILEPVPTAVQEKTLFYGGVLQEDRGIHELVSAVADHSDWSLTIVGYGPLENWLTQQASRLAQLEFLGPRSHAELLSLMSTSELVAALYDPKNGNNRRTASNKAAEAIMLGRPLITARGTAIGDFVAERGIGFVIDMSEKGSVGDVLKQYPERRSSVSARIKLEREDFLREHGGPLQITRLKDTLNECLGRSSAGK